MTVADVGWAAGCVAVLAIIGGLVLIAAELAGTPTLVDADERPIPPGRRTATREAVGQPRVASSKQRIRAAHADWAGARGPHLRSVGSTATGTPRAFGPLVSRGRAASAHRVRRPDRDR